MLAADRVQLNMLELRMTSSWALQGGTCLGGPHASLAEAHYDSLPEGDVMIAADYIGTVTLGDGTPGLSEVSFTSLPATADSTVDKDEDLLIGRLTVP